MLLNKLRHAINWGYIIISEILTFEKVAKKFLKRHLHQSKHLKVLKTLTLPDIYSL